MDGQIRAFSSVVFLNSVGKARIVQLACPPVLVFQTTPPAFPIPLFSSPLLAPLLLLLSAVQFWTRVQNFERDAHHKGRKYIKTFNF